MTHLAIPVGASDHVQGPGTAPVTIVEYGDCECSSCGGAYPTLKALACAAGPRLRFVLRNFPLAEMRPHALHAAAFAEAAAEAGRFWEAHDLLYENRAALGDAHLLGYGDRLGLDPAAVRAALAGCYADRIRADFLGGVRSGVNGTPTLFVNSFRYDGPRDLESLAALAQDLSPSIPAA